MKFVVQRLVLTVVASWVLALAGCGASSSSKDAPGAQQTPPAVDPTSPGSKDAKGPIPPLPK